MTCSDPWDRVLALAWDSYRLGSLPIGAVVVDETGSVAAQGRNSWHGEGAESSRLANSRIAHAEVNALAQLPVRPSAFYADHSLLTNVEPCCMCVGAAIQSGIGTIRYGWADAYAGAATCMTVDNPQVRQRRLTVIGPQGGIVEQLTGLLVMCHYLYVRPGVDHVVATFAEAEPELHSLAQQPAVAGIVEAARRSHATVRDLLHDLGPTAR